MSLFYRALSPVRHAKIKSTGRRRLTAELASAYGWSCHYCSTTLDEGTATLDHIWPRVLGGRNGLANLCLACGSCNSRLGDVVGKCACNRCQTALTREAFTAVQNAWDVRDVA